MMLMQMKDNELIRRIRFLFRKKSSTTNSSSSEIPVPPLLEFILSLLEKSDHIPTIHRDQLRK